jgi:RNA polymerase sigma factor (sigma-70 family)
VQSDSQVPPCATTVQRRAIDQIERLLAQAFGHGACDAILRRTAQRINDFAIRYGWGANLRERYSGKEHVLSPYIKDDLEKSNSLQKATDTQRPGMGHNSQLTADDLALVVKHWPLVDSEAQKLARKDTELNDRLTAVGRIELEKQVRRWDRTRGVTFGAFVRERIHGCMVNYIDRVWNREPRRRSWADDQGKRWFEGMTRRPRSRLRSMLADWLAPPPKSQLIPGKRSQEMAEAALAGLNPKQLAVYRGRVLTNPPLSRSDIARQLGIADPTQVSRIERQARRKMRKA